MKAINHSTNETAVSARSFEQPDEAEDAAVTRKPSIISRIGAAIPTHKNAQKDDPKNCIINFPAVPQHIQDAFNNQDKWDDFVRQQRAHVTETLDTYRKEGREKLKDTTPIA
eukprot:CFRG2651T1